MKTCFVSSVILGRKKYTARIVTRQKGYAYLFSFVEVNHTIVYDVKESIFKSKRFDVNIIIIFKEVKCELCFS